jgi:hypothetical protein
MKNQLKPFTVLVEKLTKGNTVLRIVIYAILLVCLISVITSIIMHFSK